VKVPKLLRLVLPWKLLIRLDPPKEDSVSDRPRPRYVVQLRDPLQWLGENRHWVDEQKDAKRFNSFLEANAASDGYDVIVRTVEK